MANFKCGFCKDDFTLSKKLVNHLKNCALNIQECWICDKEDFSNTFEVLDHLEDIHPSEEQNGKIFISERFKKLERCLRRLEKALSRKIEDSESETESVHDSLEEENDDDIVELSKADEEAIAKRSPSTKSKKKTIICKDCNKELSGYPSLKRHINRFHLNPDQRFTCKECLNSYTYLDSLKKHIKSCH